MKSKAPLALMEQAVGLVVFALAAVLCLRSFLWADAQSQTIAARDQAVVQAQSAAEALKGTGGDFSQAAQLLGGDWDGQAWRIFYDKNWQPTEENPAYTLRAVSTEKEVGYLGTAEVTVWQGETCLVSLSAAWQEESHG